jgi:hypothetical protein
LPPRFLKIPRVGVTVHVASGMATAAVTLAETSWTRACSDAPPLVVIAIVTDAMPSEHMFVRSARYYGYPLRFGYLNRSSTFNAARLQRKLELLRSTCTHTVVMVVDAFDVFFNQPATEALRRFQAMNRSLVCICRGKLQTSDPDLVAIR